MNCKKVLIIDDDNELCQELAEMLTAEGYVTEYCSDSRVGEKLAIKAEYDVVILDYKMPYKTGIDIIREMKENNVNTKILMVSGRLFIGKVLEEEGLQGMVTGLVSKPIDFDELLRNLSKC